MDTDRRGALQTLGIGMAAGALSSAAPMSAYAQVSGRGLVSPDATNLMQLINRLAKIPRNRDFKTVPMILTSSEQWDSRPIAELMAYQPKPKQAWDVTDIAGPWLNLLRNALNAQIWSFKNPDFLAVALCHGTANCALYDQYIWEKYQIEKIVGGKLKKNSLIVESGEHIKGFVDFENESGLFSPEGTSIPVLMRRGVVFMACHNAIWEQSRKLHGLGINPDKMGVDELAAELTNHLIRGVVLTPGAVATMPELQMAGFFYAK